MRDPLGRVSELQYDAAGNPIGVQATGSGPSTIVPDAHGNPLTSANPLGETQTFAYSALDRMTSWKDPLNHEIKYGRDASGNLTSMTYPDDSTETFAYDDHGNLIRTTDRLGQRIRFMYNSRGQVTRKTLPDLSFVDYTYNARANLETVEDATGVTRLEYLDAQNPDLVTKITYPSGRFLAYTYQKGLRTRMVDQSGFEVNYSYDAAARLDVLRDAAGALIVDYDYDSTGRRVQERRGNGTVTNYLYDNAGQLKEILHHAPDGAIQSDIIYEYDSLGRRMSESTNGAVASYDYDGAGRLTQVTLPAGRTITYEYDAAGNRKVVHDGFATTNYAINALNEYTSFGTTNQTFDTAGNLTAVSAAAGNTSYRYDAEGRLVGEVGPTGVWTYEYDAFGSRVATTHNGVRTEYLIDPTGLGDVVAEYDGSGALAAHYVHGLGLTSRVDAAGPSAYYQFDGNGNTTQLTGATGTVVNSYRYLPFGEQLSASETVANSFEYVGQFGVMREGSGLDYMRNRWYAPNQGRFTQPDPIGLAGGTNFYSYVSNRPTSLIDPLGLAPPGGPPPGSVPMDQARVFAGEVSEYLAQAVSNLKADQAINRENIRALQSRVDVQATEIAALRAALQARSAVSLGLRFGLWAALTYEFLVIGVVATQGAVMFATGEMPPCIPGIPNALQACESPGSRVIDRFLDNVFRSHVKTFVVELLSPSEDPNDIVGPSGYGPQAYVAPAATLPFTIHFENKATALGPAAEVFVTQPLDADLDLDTFELTAFGFGTLNVEVPAGRQFYSTRLDRRAESGVFVDVTAELDRATRTAKWTFRAIDPETLDIPSDPLIGFLPPDKITPEGQGFVSYSIRPKAGLATGTRIESQGSIVFDVNAAIPTNLYVNTIDNGPPSSHVNPLPASSASTYIPVSWSGTDDGAGAAGAGVETYDVFVSENGGPYTLWLDNVETTSSTYLGAPGRHYAFYSVATDKLGHEEDAPSLADAVTDVLLPQVVGRRVFYNASRFDGNDASASSSDDLAIASDKVALLRGQTSSFANYTSYNKGLNGLMVDVAALPGAVTAGDFVFKVGNDNTPSGWTSLATSPNVTIRRGAGVGGSDRVTLVWPTGAAIRQWLQVTVKANANTGLLAPDVFYFGNAVGESGNVPGDYSVSLADELIARNNPVSIIPGTSVANRFDYNRDGTVSVIDQLLSRNNITTTTSKLKQITVPSLLNTVGLVPQGLDDAVDDIVLLTLSRPAELRTSSANSSGGDANPPAQATRLRPQTIQTQSSTAVDYPSRHCPSKAADVDDELLELIGAGR